MVTIELYEVDEARNFYVGADGYYSYQLWTDISEEGLPSYAWVAVSATETTATDWFLFVGNHTAATMNFSSETKNVWFYAGNGDDNLSGGNQSDRIDGAGGDNIINGRGGDDLIWAGTGSNTIDGGDDFDVVTFEGLRADYTALQFEDQLHLVNSVTGAISTLENVEFVTFSDGSGRTALEDGHSMLLEMAKFAGHVYAPIADDIELDAAWVPLEAWELGLPTSGDEPVEWSMEGGLFKTSGIFSSSVAAAEVWAADGKLMIAFRGTDTSFLDAISDVSDWGDPETQYAELAPLIEGIRNFLTNNDERLEVYVTGHSLGGALVELFMEDFPDHLYPNIHGATFGGLGTDILTGFHDERLVQIAHGEDGVPKVEDYLGSKLTVTRNDLSTTDDDGFLLGGIIGGIQLITLGPVSLYEHRMATYLDTVQRLHDAKSQLLATAQIGRDEGIAEFHAFALALEAYLDPTYSVEAIDMRIGLGTDGSDEIGGEVNNEDDRLFGLKGSDTLKGFGGDDFLSGGIGNDILEGGEGDDILFGEGGKDIASYESADSGVVVSLTKSEKFQNTVGAGVDFLYSIESIFGSRYADKLTGDKGSNGLAGGRGNDIIKGGGGKDFISGNKGNDKLYGQGGKDRFEFGRKDGKDVILDFQDRKDKLDFSFMNYKNANQALKHFYEIGSGKNDVVGFSHKGTQITIKGLDLKDISAADLIV